MLRLRLASLAAFGAACLVAGRISYAAEPAQEELVNAAREAMRRAVRYFTAEVATHGGYLWSYSEDLTQREGEGKATPTQIWVQPPGTPAVGFAYLRAYEVTKDTLYLDAARAAAEALAWGQLACGGWDYRIDFDEQASEHWYYRRDKEAGEAADDRRNRGTFDDNTTQSAVRFLMAAATAAGDDNLHAAARYSLRFMMDAQFPNGAWPQWYPLADEGYSRWYTFTDNAINDCIAVMLDAYHTYDEAGYLERAKRGGDFIVLSQVPAPQAGWAQQYDYDLKPAWARWFEPPAVCSAVTARNMNTLMDLYLETGEEKCLRPIPAAIAWLRDSRRSDGTWARFYELETNRPIYVNMKREIVYEFVDIRPGYSWHGEYGVAAAIRRYEKVSSQGRAAYLAEQQRAPTQQEVAERTESLAARTKTVIEAQDERGRWVSDGRVNCRDFIRNLGTLSDYIAACASSAHLQQ
ncbi:MAG: hypothetical protein JSV65_16865 [Armatimonadota bacterium]|nr:MAG: hypothetical protein JSV65_16865 [Armatimonadota bacterium]